MNQPPLNPDALDETALANLIAWKSLPFGATQFVKLDANAAHKVIELLRPHLAAALPEVTSVEQWDALPIGTMVRVHFNGNSELIIRCPANSGAGIGGMSFLGGRHWSDAFTVWNADKLEIKYIPEVKP